MAGPSSKMVEEMRLRLESEFGWRLSPESVEMCIFFRNVHARPTFGETLNQDDVHRIRQTMKESLCLERFEEGTAERALNMFKLGTDLHVKAIKPYTQGDIVAFLGPYGAMNSQELPAAETYHMEAGFFGDKRIVWSPSADINDPDSIGSYVTDCHTFDVVEPVHANIDYHTTYYVAKGLKVPIPVIVANQDIEAGQMIVGDFGATFFYEPRYMLPNMKAMARDEVSRKRKRQEPQTTDEDNKRFKALNDRVNTLEESLANANKACAVYEQTAEKAQKDFETIQLRFQSMKAAEDLYESQVEENSKLQAQLAERCKELEDVKTRLKRRTEHNNTLQNQILEQFEVMREVRRKNVELTRLASRGAWR